MPNTPGLRSLQGTKQIKKLIRTLKDLPNCPPLLVKIAPDLSNEAIDEIARVAMENGIDGIIAINTSLDRFDLKKSENQNWQYSWTRKWRIKWSTLTKKRTRSYSKTKKKY